MEIKDLEEKVKKAEEKVEKAKKTIERHEQQLEKKQKANAEEYEIKWKQDDIKGATKKLVEAERILDNWKSKLNKEIEKERFLNDNAPQVIKDFLEKWKDDCFQWYIQRYDKYLDFTKQLNEDKKAAQIEYIKNAPEYADKIDENGNINCELHWITSIPNKKMEAYLVEKGLDWKGIRKRRIEFAGHVVLTMCEYRDEVKRLEWLNKELEAEKKAKMVDLIYRINKVVGTITDATQLKIGITGNLEGIIIGTEGKAKIETIGAGGWNIQVFHFRTLVHKL